jgi:P-type Mg2+ transporter
LGVAVSSRYWSLSADDVARALESTPAGLSASEAERRLRKHGPNELEKGKRLSRIGVLVDQLRSPLVLLLLFAAVASGLGGEWTDSGMVMSIVLASVGIGYAREYAARRTIAGLRAKVLLRSTVLRDGSERSVPAREVVPGDVVLLSAGSLVPADGVLVAATDCFVNEGALTGESFPTEKLPGIAEPEAGLRDQLNCLFMGTSVRSGLARLLVVRTGAATRFGDVARRLALRPPETEFDRGLRHFGYLLLTVMFVMVLVVFAVNVVMGRPALETLLFSVALAVGLSPELLPAILGVNLARAAQALGKRGVLVRRLNAIENLGSMDVLCTDKTGTLTEGIVQLAGAYDAAGTPDDSVRALGACNAGLHTGLSNPLDEAILAAHPFTDAAVEKLGEIPYDFVRKRVSVVVRRAGAAQLVAKGVFPLLIEACTHTADGRPLDAPLRAALDRRFREWSAEGIRVLGVATRTLPKKASFGRTDEADLSFAGFLTFLDQPKAGARDTLRELARLGVAVKVVTGDSALVAQHVAREVGLRADATLTGVEMATLSDEALWHRAEATDLFAEVDPNQKERIVRALKKTGHVVGFLGDGVNDAAAMHAADTSLSVDQAVDVAKEAADFVLMERDLDVIRKGVEEGRRTFANTLKYVLTTTSANLGNMVSMAVASLLLPFLPLLAGQVLLNNFLSDIPAVGLAGDRVDPELLDRPRRWDMRFIGRFMASFGAISSLFDFLTFGVLLAVFRAGAPLFRTAWFVESLLTELLVALVVRTMRPIQSSRPGRLLLVLTGAVVLLAVAIPYVPGAHVLGFVPLPGTVLAAVAAIAILYAAVTEWAKRRFLRGAGMVAVPRTAG